jgi:hypothetical protein
MTFSILETLQEFDRDRAGHPAARARLVVILGLALLSANAFAQSGDAPLPGVVRAAAAAFRHFSDPAASPQSARDVDGLRNHVLFIDETDADYKVRIVRTDGGDTRNQSLKGVVYEGRYRVGKQDFRILEARQRILNGEGGAQPEIRLPLPKPAAAQNAAPLPGFLRALAAAYQEFPKRDNMRDFGVAVGDESNYYRITFGPRPELGVVDYWEAYQVDKQDFQVRHCVSKPGRC